MDDVEWMNLYNNHSGFEGMWLLNKFFLLHCIAKDCDFVLTTVRDSYCINGIKVTDDSYARELGYIYKRGYIWPTGCPAYTRVSK